MFGALPSQNYKHVRNVRRAARARVFANMQYPSFRRVAIGIHRRVTNGCKWKTSRTNYVRYLIKPYHPNARPSRFQMAPPPPMPPVRRAAAGRRRESRHGPDGVASPSASRVGDAPSRPCAALFVYFEREIGLSRLLPRLLAALYFTARASRYLYTHSMMISILEQ